MVTAWSTRLSSKTTNTPAPLCTVTPLLLGYKHRQMDPLCSVLFSHPGLFSELGCLNLQRCQGCIARSSEKLPKECSVSNRPAAAVPFSQKGFSVRLCSTNWTEDWCGGLFGFFFGGFLAAVKWSQSPSHILVCFYLGNFPEESEKKEVWRLRELLSSCFWII